MDSGKFAIFLAQWFFVVIGSQQNLILLLCIVVLRLPG